MPEPRPTVVLVHGALTDASVWHRVIANLRERGLQVLAPALPMRSLDGDAAHLRGVLTALGDGLVVIAGHSSGGSVISRPKALTRRCARWCSSPRSPRTRARRPAS